VKKQALQNRLQGFNPDLDAAANSFALDAWRQASTVGACRAELRVTRGSVSIVLQQIESAGGPREFSRLQATAPGAAFSPPIFLPENSGRLLPVVESASPDALFDLSFGTNDRPFLPQGKTAFVLAGPPAMLTASAAAFEQFRAADEQARDQLVLVDDSGSLHLDPVPGCHLLPNEGTVEAGAIGRALNEIAYGNLGESLFSHVCLYQGDVAPHPELFARTAAFHRYLRPRQMLGASGAEQRGWHWLCTELRDIYLVGLPYPFLGTASGLDYLDRLQTTGLSLTTSPNLCPHQDDPVPLSACSAWALQALRGTLTSEDLQATLHEASSDPALALVLRGPEALIHRHLLDRGYPLPPQPGLTLRLARKGRQLLDQLDRALSPKIPAAWHQQRLQRHLEQLQQITERYATARRSFSTHGYWQQMADNSPPEDPCFTTRRRSAWTQHRDLTALHLKDNSQQRLAQPRQDFVRIDADRDRANRTLLSLLRNSHKGERAVIIGNGPSLKVADLEQLTDCVTFASNKIYLAYEETRWRPDYYSVEDHLVIFNNWEQIQAVANSIKIFPANVRDFGFHAADTIFAPFLPPKSFDDPLSDPEFPGFSDDLSRGICWGSTIVYSQIQMAMHMGCSEIVLIGVDHSYQLPSVKQGNQYLYEGEQNHFHPDYRKLGEKWHQPNLEVLEHSYAQARDHCAARGVTVLNASRQTQLTVFERAKFDQVFPPRKDTR